MPPRVRRNPPRSSTGRSAGLPAGGIPCAAKNAARAWARGIVAAEAVEAIVRAGVAGPRLPPAAPDSLPVRRRSDPVDEGGLPPGEDGGAEAEVVDLGFPFPREPPPDGSHEECLEPPRRAAPSNLANLRRLLLRGYAPERVGATRQDMEEPDAPLPSRPRDAAEAVRPERLGEDVGEFGPDPLLPDRPLEEPRAEGSPEPAEGHVGGDEGGREPRRPLAGESRAGEEGRGEGDRGEERVDDEDPGQFLTPPVERKEEEDAEGVDEVEEDMDGDPEQEQPEEGPRGDGRPEEPHAGGARGGEEGRPEEGMGERPAHLEDLRAEESGGEDVQVGQVRGEEEGERRPPAEAPRGPGVREGEAEERVGQVVHGRDTRPPGRPPRGRARSGPRSPRSGRGPEGRRRRGSRRSSPRGPRRDSGTRRRSPPAPRSRAAASPPRRSGPPRDPGIPRRSPRRRRRGGRVRARPPR